MNRPTNVTPNDWANHIKKNYTRPFVNDNPLIAPQRCVTCTYFSNGGYFNKVNSFMCVICYAEAIDVEAKQLELFHGF